MKRRDSDYSRSGRRGGACVISLIVIAALTTAAQTAGAEVGSGEVTLQPRQPYGLAAVTDERSHLCCGRSSRPSLEARP